MMTTKKQTRKPKLLNTSRSTATHEAGHAVIGRVLTLLCGSASIVGAESSLGRSVTAHEDDCTMEWLIRGKERGTPVNRWCAAAHARIMTCMAGREAEEVLLGRFDGGDGGDLERITEISNALIPGIDAAAAWDKCEARLRRMTRMLVHRHRERIARVADALLAKGRLTRRELDKLTGRSIDDLKLSPLDCKRERQIKAGQKRAGIKAPQWHRRLPAA
jgi:hypothetical protein